jgi:glyoxylase-like metal-dependent hydrolase (beta-lactamase superfamily II)
MARPEASGFEVFAVRYGTLHAPKSEFFYRHSSYGEPDAEVEMAYWFWLLRRGDETIVVDCGFAPDVGARRGRTCLQAPPDALRALGVEPESVSIVLASHLHYDHIGNLAAFPAATLIVARRELEFWTGPMARRFQFASHVEEREIALVEEAAAGGRVRLTDGTEEIADGVTTIAVGGHSPGQLIAIVRSEGGIVVLASDAAHFYEELEFERPFGVVHDLERMYAAYDLLKEFERTGAEVVPGHDPEVGRRYPRAQAAGAVEAVRIGCGQQGRK